MDQNKFIETELIPGMVKRGELKLSTINGGGIDIPKIHSVEILPVSMDDTFMLSICSKVKVKLVGESIDDETEYQLVVKLTPIVNESMYIATQFDLLYENESIAYKDVIPCLDSGDYPRYVYSHRKNLEACMVLCDFTQLGWRMSNEVYNLSLEHGIVAMKALGKFHGSCYALKESDSQLFHSIVGKLKESRYSQDVNSVWNAMQKSGIIRATKAVRESDLKDKVPEEFLKKLEQVLENPQTYGKRAVRPRTPLATICHGDFLRNNIAFKYSHENPDIPTNAMMFDFQTLRYSSPMVDAVVFMLNSMGQKVRTENFDLLFDSYYNEVINILTNKLNKIKDKLPSYYSRDLFLKEYARLLPFGLGIAASFLPVLHEPYGMNAMEILENDMSLEEHLNIADARGGELANIELRSIVFEIYHLQKKLNLELDYFY